MISEIDGDTFWAKTSSNEKICIRLASVDCPDKGQEFRQEALEALRGMIFGKVIQVDSLGIDNPLYERTLAFIHVGDKDVNAELLKQGLAWHATEHSDSEVLAKLESDARKSKTGLWSEPDPVEPWKWRPEQKEEIQEENELNWTCLIPRDTIRLTG